MPGCVIASSHKVRTRSWMWGENSEKAVCSRYHPERRTPDISICRLAASLLSIQTTFQTFSVSESDYSELDHIGEPFLTCYDGVWSKCYLGQSSRQMNNGRQKIIGRVKLWCSRSIPVYHHPIQSRNTCVTRHGLDGLIAISMAR